jgi:UDP-N-acetylmuramoyl-L-alanyl-D-glutamate--2,6-diaminopimelate ligase
MKSDNFFTYSIKEPADYFANNIVSEQNKLSFEINSLTINNNFLGQFNVYNILASIATVAILGFDLQQIVKINLKGVPGRQEWISVGQDFLVLVDYAPEPESLKQLYQALDKLKYKKLIHVIGSCGGGRDRTRQPILGKMSAEKADIVIVTNEDPYDDDPEAIIANVAQGALESGKILNENLFKVSNRGEAIAMALKLAKKDDLVLITGKGAEQFICVANEQKIPWDDRQVVKDILEKGL